MQYPHFRDQRGWMAGSFINIHAYSDALVVLATASVVVPVVRKLGMSPVLGYLGAGAVLGPLGLGSFIDKVPWLYWVTVPSSPNLGSCFCCS
jgi:CPA2 family monovalent cation:H+ antiporter-2